MSATQSPQTVSHEPAPEAFRALADHVDLLVVLLDHKGSITYVNAAVSSLLGKSHTELVGQSWFAKAMAPEASESESLLFAAALKRSSLSSTARESILAHDGETRRVEWHQTLVEMPSGQPPCVGRIGRDITSAVHEDARRHHDALHDALTSLPNRSLFLERVALAIARSKRHDSYEWAVLFVDLDRFKVINDSLGHSVGDELLKLAGQTLRDCVRPEDTVARLGGDEFAILIDDIRAPVEATRLANRIHDALTHPFTLKGVEAFTTASIGIALSATGYEGPEDVLRDADNAMYRAKARGKARHEIFDKSMHQRAVDLLELETDLRRAVERNELFLVYQPIVYLRTGSVVGFEALVRWRHPQRGLVSPAEFIPLAEETGLILPIGRWVLTEACEEFHRWMSRSPTANWLSLSVNLSPRQFLAPGLYDDIERTLLETGMAPAQLKLELTEGALMENPETAAQVLTRLRERGVGLAIDDFGTGYSSLSYLLRFPIDTVKIDRSFVTGMSTAENAALEDNMELVRAIVSLARNLGMEVVAEGVETDGQRIRLEAVGCNYAQGFLFSRPVEAGKAAEMVAQAVMPRARRGATTTPPDRA